MANSGFSRTQISIQTPFEALRNPGFNGVPSGVTSTDVQNAIEEIYQLAQNSSRGFVFVSYNGNAGTGRYMEMFPGITMNDAPLQVVNEFNVIATFSRTVATSATATVGFYNLTPTIPVLLYTVTFSNQKFVANTGSPSSPLFTLPAGGQLAIKIDSGSINKPHIYFTGQGG
jgi:hypothetical protein